MMILLKRLALALCLVLSYSSYSNAQNVTTTGTTDLVPGTVYTTGDLVQMTTTTTGSTWTNAVYQDNLTCWAWGDPGYCGPNPIVRSGGNINFSFGWTDIYQQIQLSNAITNAIPGLRVNGYNFSFSAKNGNGWDNGQPDYLYAYTQFNGLNGESVYNRTHNISNQYNWSWFNFSDTFATPYAVKDLSTVRYGFVGGDSNGWAGPYGPEITQVGFSLKYSVDPCATNPMYSPTCPGYLEALAKLAPPPPEVAAAAPPPPDVASPPVAGSPPPPGSSPQQNSSDTPPPPGPAERPGQPQSAVAANSAPSATNPQAKIGEVAVAGAPAKSSSGPSMSMIMSILNTESSRVGAVEKSAVSAAVAGAEAAGAQATQQAEAVAGSLTSQSIAASLTTSGGSSLSGTVFGNQSQSSVFSLSNLNQSTGPNSTMLRISSQPSAIESTVSTASISSSAISYSLSSPNRFATEVETPKTEGIKFGGGSALNDLIEPKALLQSSAQEQSNDAVNKNAQSNELAGGVDIASMATQPRGYNLYTQATLSDAAFYKVDSIYKNQTTVDNVRVMRGLTGGSDRLHQNMVDQQYNRQVNK